MGFCGPTTPGGPTSSLLLRGSYGGPLLEGEGGKRWLLLRLRATIWEDVAWGGICQPSENCGMYGGTSCGHLFLQQDRKWSRSETRRSEGELRSDNWTVSNNKSSVYLA